MTDYGVWNDLENKPLKAVNAFFLGDNCEEDVNGCADDPCPVGTTCTDIAAAEYRQSNLSFKCGDCPTGYDMSPSGDKCIGELLITLFWVALF